jgi:hypothetical protein
MLPRRWQWSTHGLIQCKSLDPLQSQSKIRRTVPPSALNPVTNPRSTEYDSLKVVYSVRMYYYIRIWEWIRDVLPSRHRRLVPVLLTWFLTHTMFRCHGAEISCMWSKRQPLHSACDHEGPCRLLFCLTPLPIQYFQIREEHLDS